MDKELKDKWVEALRSGKYQQGQGTLRKGDNFCCLGVLADIIDPTTWKHDSSMGVEKWGFDSISYLPSDILTYWGAQQELSNLNDEGGTFAEIADKIEEIIEVSND